MDDETTLILSWLFFTTLCQVTEVFGIMTNIINIVCFVKQGFKDPVNVSLLGLAVSDLASLVTLMCATIFLTPAVNTADMPFDVMGVYYLTAGIPHTTFTRITSWITAVITLERTLCVIAPLQVKRIVTSKRLSVIIVCIFILLISSLSPIYACNKLEWKFSHERNKTLLLLAFTSDRNKVEHISWIINTFIPLSAFVIIITCTIILVTSFRRRTNWLQSVTSTANADFLLRNRRLAKMVVMISALFISCFAPFSVIVMAVAFLPEINVGGTHVNVGKVLAGVGFLLESINSSTNIFIYYNMSSKYRETFNMVFRRRISRKTRQ